MKKLLAMIEDIWVVVAFAEHDALPHCDRTGCEARSSLHCLRAAV
jgi:hypothetical protein